MAGDQEIRPSFPSRLEGRWSHLGRYRALVALICCFPLMAFTLAMPILAGSEKTEAAAHSQPFLSSLISSLHLPKSLNSLI